MFAHRPARLLLACGLVLGCGLLVAGILAGSGESRALLARLAGGFFLAFGSLKGALALSARHRLALGGAASAELVASHGSPREVQRWVGYKFIAMTVAFLGAAVCLAYGWR